MKLWLAALFLLVPAAGNAWVYRPHRATPGERRLRMEDQRARMEARRAVSEAARARRDAAREYQREVLRERRMERRRRII